MGEHQRCEEHNISTKRSNEKKEKDEAGQADGTDKMTVKPESQKDLFKAPHSSQTPLVEKTLTLWLRYILRAHLHGG